ncbi:hypothetical protein AC792_01060 [Arthrobacter sp. RIT-PI-e]|nr:hypothetical protein AC792_01060 [Arthrobacter sp. RIT-PI-e]
MAGLGVGGALAITGWFAIGPDHIIYAVVVQCGFLLMALLAGPAVVDVARSRYQVANIEPRIYTLLGAEVVRRVLDGVGWNRVIKQMRQSEGGESGVAGFLRGTEQSETGHLLGAAATVALAITAVSTHHPLGAVQVLALGLVLHGYPIMIQRIVRARITQRRTHRYRTTH